MTVMQNIVLIVLALTVFAQFVLVASELRLVRRKLQDVLDKLRDRP